MTVATDWYQTLIDGWIPGDTVRLKGSAERVGPEHPHVRAYYEAKRRVVERTGARSICEIGVRAGYSMVAMLSANPEAEFGGFDIGDPAYDSAAGDAMSFALNAVALLNRLGNRPAYILQADSQGMDTLPQPVTTCPQWHLVHIDGDHTEAGCLSDLRLCDRSGVRWVLVDDYDYLADVKRAVDWFLVNRPCEHEFIHDPLRGHCLMRLH